MMIKLRRIERFLRLNPHPRLPEELHEQLKADLSSCINARDQAATFLTKQWSSRVVMALLLMMITIVLSGAGIYFIIQSRFKHAEEVPAHRLRDVAEPYIPQKEDIVLIPQTLHENILELRRRVELHQAATSQIGKWALLDLQPDGAVFFWVEYGPETMALMAATDYQYHANEHPNDYRISWEYNLDGSPIPIKAVKPHDDEQWKFGDIQDGGMPVGDGYQEGNGYFVQLEQPKGDIIIDKTMLFERNWAELIDQQWRLELDNFAFGGSDYLFMAIKLPAGAELIETSRPFTEQLQAEEDKRPTIIFAEALPTNGLLENLVVTYFLENISALKY